MPTKGRGAPDLRIPAILAARLVGAAHPLEGSVDLDDLSRHLTELTRRAEPVLVEETGFETSSPSGAKVLTRTEWAEANIESLLVLMDPLLRRMDSRLDGRAGALVRLGYRPALGAQMGGVLGLLSRRVLGQYDLLSEDSESVWYVGVNLVTLERRLRFEPEDFRLWVVLHELTHRLQFSANPWLREHFLASVRDLLDGMRVAPGSLGRGLIQALREPRNDGPLALRALGPEITQAFEDVQALMTLIEGHATFVMNQVGGRLIETLPRIQKALKGAQERAHPLVKLLYRLLGLELKRRQYEEGERFVEEIENDAGPGAVRLCFSSRDHLPSLEEIRSPALWVQRVAA